jgi:hypothetical protein
MHKLSSAGIAEEIKSISFGPGQNPDFRDHALQRVIGPPARVPRPPACQALVIGKLPTWEQRRDQYDPLSFREWSKMGRMFMRVARYAMHRNKHGRTGSPLTGHVQKVALIVFSIHAAFEHDSGLQNMVLSLRSQRRLHIARLSHHDMICIHSTARDHRTQDPAVAVGTAAACAATLKTTPITHDGLDRSRTGRSITGYLSCSA